MLIEKFKTKKILLGSQSPRRQELLKALGVDFKVVKISSDENYPENLRNEKITEFISLSKANAYSNLKENEILITADTLVVLNDEVLGKPIDENEAFQMIRKLAGNTHQVFTSVCVRTIEKTLTFSDKTDVIFDEFTDEEINYYIQNFHPFDKAGAYGIQDWLGYAKVKGIQGCYYNVMGFPLSKFYRKMQSF
ncbi:MAG: Maf family nucleotide pyrophosphatase [Weeksellaceae bacterium]|jgi:septum formation protein|nr:Maf family nucleotide pyrophosphatase [Weeksellaceae bacterium]